MLEPANFWKEKVDIHVYEEVHMDSEYLVRIEGSYSYQEFQVDGEHLDEFMAQCNFVGADIYVYKLVSSYVQIE